MAAPEPNGHCPVCGQAVWKKWFGAKPALFDPDPQGAFVFFWANAQRCQGNPETPRYRMHACSSVAK